MKETSFICTSLSETFLILNLNVNIILMYIFVHETTRYVCQILIQNEFSQHIFEKISNVIFHENPHSGNRIIACGGADGRTDSKSD